jgi:uncharacterized protein (TIGR02217 family)
VYDNVPFPLSLDRCISQTGFDTTIIPLGNGAERRFANWDDGLISFNAMPGVRSLVDLRALDVFHKRRGRARSFPVRDLLDCQAAWDGSLMPFATGTNTAGPFQLTKTYSDAANNWVREITKPESGTIKIYVGAAVKAAGVDYTIDYLTGKVTFLAGHFPAVDSTISWEGRFWVPVRFSDDKLPIEETFLNMKQDTDLAWVLPKDATANLPQILMIEDRTA